MIKETMYIETTIPSYATARASTDFLKAAKQVATRVFWENERQNYDLVISQYVIDECSKGDKDAAKRRLDFIEGIEILKRPVNLDDLALIYQNILQIPESSKTDCFHLAMSVLREIDILLTWNFTHLGPVSEAKLIEYNITHNLKTPILLSPYHLIPEVTNDVL